MDTEKIIYENVNADELITFLKPASGLGAISEILVNLTPEQAVMRVVDPAHVAMAEAVWHVRTGQDVKVGVDYDQAMKALALFTGQDIKLTITDGSVIIQGKKGRRTVPRVDPESVGAPRAFPALDLPTEICTNAAELRDAMKGVNGLSDHLTIYAEDAAKIETGDDRSKAEFYIDGTVQSSDGTGAVASYPWDYFYNVVKVLADGDLNISLGTDYPVLLCADRGDVSQRYMIAPRIEQE